MHDPTRGEKQPKWHSSPTTDDSSRVLPTMASSQAFDTIIETASSSTTANNSCTVDSHEDKSTLSKEPMCTNKSLTIERFLLECISTSFSSQLIFDLSLV
jgi:hypothetical protein